MSAYRMYMTAAWGLASLHMWPACHYALCNALDCIEGGVEPQDMGVAWSRTMRACKLARKAMPLALPDYSKEGGYRSWVDPRASESALWDRAFWLTCFDLGRSSAFEPWGGIDLGKRSLPDSDFWHN